MTCLSVTMQKKHHALFHLTAMAVIIIGVLHMCFRSNHKSQAYVNFCKKIIYPSMSWYKACSKNTNICPLTQSYCKVRGKRGENWDPLLCDYTIQWKTIFWFKCIEPMSGPSSSSSRHGAACNHFTKQHRTLLRSLHKTPWQHCRVCAQNNKNTFLLTLWNYVEAYFKSMTL